MFPCFTDERIYLQGTSTVTLINPSNGNIDYFSDKFSTGSITTSNSENIIRSGLGNGVATIIPTDCDVSVDFASDAFSLWAKGANVGAKMSYGAPVMICDTITAAGTDLVIGTEKGTPVAGISRPYAEAYVQEVGAAAPIATHGAAYKVTDGTYAIEGFSATSGKTYKVFYYVQRANAQVATIGAQFNPRVEYFVATTAGYKNVNSENSSGTRAGWLYTIIPMLKFGGANGGLTGDQTNHDQTHITGRAIAAENGYVTADCDCGAGNGGNLAYYVWVDDNEAANIAGLAVVGGVITAPVSSTQTITEFKLVMADGSLVIPDAAMMSYELTGAPSGTSVTGNVLTTGATAGDGEITGTYTVGGVSYESVANLSVVSAS